MGLPNTLIRAPLVSLMKTKRAFGVKNQNFGIFDKILDMHVDALNINLIKSYGGWRNIKDIPCDIHLVVDVVITLHLTFVLYCAKLNLIRFDSYLMFLSVIFAVLHLFWCCNFIVYITNIKSRYKWYFGYTLNLESTIKGKHISIIL